jgi:creatinine amidohydrolase
MQLLRLARPLQTGALALVLTGAAGVLPAAAHAQAVGGAAGPSSLQIEALSWTELRDRIAQGSSTVLLPIGGTEQSGPHMALGKHNVRSVWLATRIAEKLGNALVAPVLAYVPEGAIEPPTQHMRYPGSISVPVPVFEATLEAAARSFRRHGFRDVVFLGDHGGYAASLERVATRLNAEFASPRAKPPLPPALADFRVFALGEYYSAAQAPYLEALKARGVSAEEAGTHAGLADTALMMAIDPTLVRTEMLGRQGGIVKSGKDGVTGDPRRASAELGQLGVQRIVDASVAAVRARTAAPR